MSEQENQGNVEFVIQKIYLKDISFESPNVPEVFTSEWSPEANIELNTSSSKLDENIYEVTLTVTVTAKSKEKNAFLVEVKQTGIFMVVGGSEQELGHLLGAYCPSVLFPYAKEAVGSMVMKGGFPELNMAPINFDALYAQQLAQQQAETKH